MSNLDGLDWFELSRRIHWSNSEQEILELDEAISNILTEMKHINGLYYFSLVFKNYPKTKNKINEVIFKYLNGPIESRYVRELDSLIECLNDDVKDRAVELMLDGTLIFDWQITKFVRQNNSRCLTLIESFIGKYKNGKFYWSTCVRDVFEKLRLEDLDAGCSTLAKTTPALQVLLLSRQDIKEEYILVGLKALGKLKNPKQIAVRIKIEMLKRLAPKSRLEAVKQIIGYAENDWRKQNWYNRKPAVEFEITPTKEEFSELLFPCSIQFNEQVSKIVQHYDKYLERLELNKGERNE